MCDVSARAAGAPLRVIIDAGAPSWPGWIATQGDERNLLRHSDALLCEPVWEHLIEAEGRAAARLCDDAGGLHFNDGDPADGPLGRSLRSDMRTHDGQLGVVW